MAASKVASASKTHYLPADDVHYKWDVDNEPDGRHRAGRHGRRLDARHQRQPGRARLGRERARELRLGPRVPADRARSRSRVPSPATRSRSRSSTSTPRAGAGPA